MSDGHRGGPASSPTYKTYNNLTTADSAVLTVTFPCACCKKTNTLQIDVAENSWYDSFFNNVMVSIDCKYCKEGNSVKIKSHDGPFYV